MHMGGQGPSESEDIQLVIAEAATGNPPTHTERSGSQMHQQNTSCAMGSLRMCPISSLTVLM